MYYVVEFTDEGGGGISIIREEWLTPRKQRCMWPPQKLMSKFNKCIDGSINVDGTWEKYSIKRVFYETESLTKAREKAKQAEVDSEVNSDDTKTLVCRQRKKTKKIYESETSDDNTSDDNNNVVYPTPPATQLGQSQVAATPGTSAVKYQKLLAACPKVRATPVSSDNDSNDLAGSPPSTQRSSTKHQKLLAACPKVRATPVSSDNDSNDLAGSPPSTQRSSTKHQKLLAACPKVRATPVSSDNDSNDLAGSPPSTQRSSSFLLSELDSTLTPNLKEAPYSETLAIIAKHLARIECDMKELQIGQNEMLQRIRASSATPIEHSLPADIKVPCEDREDLSKIESWIAITENAKLLVTYLSLVGGNKTPIIIRRILEKLFTNNLAVLCNWTGKNEKLKLKDLKLIDIIRGKNWIYHSSDCDETSELSHNHDMLFSLFFVEAVRRNQIAEKATDAEIHEVISNWFRFTKDRNGGRESRRVKK